jgi:hypothetical protein
MEAQAQLIRFYDNAALLSAPDCMALFGTPIEDHIEKGTKHMTNWIRRNAKVLKQLKQRTKKQQATGQSTMPQFYKPSDHNLSDTRHFTHTARDPNTRLTIYACNQQDSRTTTRNLRQPIITQFFQQVLPEVTTCNQTNTQPTPLNMTSELSNNTTQTQSESTILEKGC